MLEHKVRRSNLKCQFGLMPARAVLFYEDFVAKRQGGQGN